MTHLDDGADLRAVMDRSLSGLDAPDHVGPAAMASGRRTRARRRVTISLTGVAAVAAVTALALPALGGGGGATTPGTPADSASDVAPPTPKPSDPMTPSEGPDEWPTAGVEIPPGWWDMPSTQMVDVLESTLPEGVTVTRADTTTEGPDGPAPAFGGLSGILAAESGPGSFQLLLYPPDSADYGLYVTSDTAGESTEGPVMATGGLPLTKRLKCLPHYDTCLRIRDGSGEQIGRVSSDVESGTTLFEAFLLGPDGGGLNFTVMDSSGEKPGYESPSAEAPPLTPSQLRTLAEDPVWTSFVP